MEKATLSTNEKGQPSYTLTFQVLTDSRFDGPRIAEGAVPVSFGDFYVFGGVFDTRARAKTANTTTRTRYEDNGVKGFVYDVVVNYGQFDPGETPGNPFKPAQFSWSFDDLEQIVDFDANSDPIINSAGDLFDPPVVREISRLRLSVVQNEVSFNPALAILFQNKINSDPFGGAKAGQVLCKNIGATGPNFENDFRFFSLQYDFAYSEKGWSKEILDAGMREIKNGKKQNIILDGSPITTPFPLDGNGEKLAQGSPAVKRTYQVYEALPFTPVFNFRL